MPATAVDRRALWEESKSVFEEAQKRVYRFVYDAEILVRVLRGGVPSDPKVAEGWIRTKFRDKDSVIQELVRTTMAERNGDPAKPATPEEVEEAITEVANSQTLNGFKRTKEGFLYLEGRQFKAMIKEAINIRHPKGRWGPSAKGTRSYFAEHVFVPDIDVLLLDPDGNPITEPDGVAQEFVHARFGAAIKQCEYVEGPRLRFQVLADFDLDAERTKPGEDPRSWADLFATAEKQGIGADRSQGFGTFKVTSWTRRD